MNINNLQNEHRRLVNNQESDNIFQDENHVKISIQYTISVLENINKKINSPIVLEKIKYLKNYLKKK